MSERILERIQIVPMGVPADVNGAGLTGDYVSLEHYDRCLVVVSAGDGTASNDLSVTLYQATDVSGTGAKALNAMITGTVFTKEHASALTGVGQWTEATVSSATNAYAPTDSGEQVLLWGFEVKASDLDVANGFDCLRADLNDPGASKVAAGFYLLGDPKYPAAPASMKSALAD